MSTAVRLKRSAGGKDADEFFSQIFMAWLKDTREAMTAEKAKRFREIFDKGVNDKEFQLRSIRLGVNTALAVGQSLLRLPLQKLDLYENLVRDTGAEALAVLIKESASLTHLNLGGNDIGPVGILHLAAAIPNHKRIQVLILGSGEGDMHANRMDSTSGKALAEAIKKNKTIKHLDLNRNPLGAGGEQEAFKSLASLLEKHPQLHTLKLGGTGMSSESAVEIVTKLANNNQVHELDFHNNDLPYAVAEAFSKVFLERSNRNQKVPLQRLDLHNNPRIGERGSSPLFNALCYPETTISILNVSNTGVTDDAVLCLANALKYTSSLQSINLSKNYITELGCMALSQQLEGHDSVTYLSLSCNKIRCEGAIAMAATLENNNILQTLELDETRVGDQGCIALGVSLASNTSLVRLHLTSNHVSDEAGRAFTSLLEKNRTIQNIKIRGNQVDHATQVKLKKILKRNKGVKENEVPNRLHKEVIRLHYQQCKLQEANNQLQQHQSERLRLQEKMDSHDEKLMQEREETEKKSNELTEKIGREEQDLEEILQKRSTKEQEFLKFQEDIKVDIERLSERLTEETKKREAVEEALQEKKKTLDDLYQDRENERKKVEDDIFRVQADTDHYLTQAEEMKTKQQALQKVLSSLESMENDRAAKDADRRSAAEAMKLAKKEKAKKRKEDEEAAAELLFE